MKITNINDYVDEVAEQFPELSKEDVKRILVYGWKMILQYSSAGNDIFIFSGKLFFFIGELRNNALKNFKVYCTKLAKRIRFMFKRTNSQWDGYYYFTRSESQYKEYLSQSKKKYKVFKDVFLYKLLEEAQLANPNAPYVFRLNESKTNWMYKYYKELKTENAELIMTRDALQMNDILVTKNKYKYIQ